MQATPAHQLERIVAAARPYVSDYLDLFSEIAGPNLQSLTLCGPIATGTFVPEREPIRSVAVLGEVELDQLRELAANAVKLKKRRIAAPLIMTPKFLDESRDTFPLELLEIGQCHVTVFGPDPFADLEVADDDVRHQCERELKSLLVELRQGLLSAAGKESLLGNFEADIAEKTVRTLRGLLWLKNVRDPRTTADVIGRARQVLDVELTGVRHTLNRQRLGWPAFVELYRDLEALRNIADVS